VLHVKKFVMIKGIGNRLKLMSVIDQKQNSLTLSAPSALISYIQGFIERSRVSTGT
jgi:hypothetical protein